jgi:hypothetical protein
MNASTTSSCWAIEHRKGCFLRGDNAIGYELYTTQQAAQNAIDDSKLKNATPIKVNIKIEGAHVWNMKKSTKKKTTSVRPATVQARECMTVQLAISAKAQASNP